MTRKLLLLALPAALLLGGCVSVHATRIGTPTQYEPVPREHVLVYRTEEEVPYEYEAIAILHAEGDVDGTNERQMIDAARKKAGKLGANAIVLGEFREPRMSTRIAAAVFDVPVERKARFLAIRVREDAPRAAGAGEARP